MVRTLTYVSKDGSGQYLNGPMQLGKPLIREWIDKIKKLQEVIMAKRKTPLEKIGKELEKLEKLHEKEEAIIEKINEIIEEGNEEEDHDFDKWEGTDPD